MEEHSSQELGPFEPPIQNLDAIDVISKLHDGGVVLYVTCCGPLDGSLDTLSRLEKKVNGYLAEIPTQSFREEIGPSNGKSVRIVIVCEYPVSALAAGMIKSLTRIAQGQTVELVRATSVSSAV